MMSPLAVVGILGNFSFPVWTTHCTCIINPQLRPQLRPCSFFITESSALFSAQAPITSSYHFLHFPLHYGKCSAVSPHGMWLARIEKVLPGHGSAHFSKGKDDVTGNWKSGINKKVRNFDLHFVCILIEPGEKIWKFNFNRILEMGFKV